MSDMQAENICADRYQYTSAYSYSYSYRVTLFNISSQHCTVVGLSEKVSFQLRSELLATDVR